MTLSASTHPDTLRGFHPTALTGRVIPFPPARADRTRHVLTVEFSSLDGRTSQAIGGGDTVAAAIAFARESCPADATWQAIGWSDLYGD